MYINAFPEAWVSVGLRRNVIGLHRVHASQAIADLAGDPGPKQGLRGLCRWD